MGVSQARKKLARIRCVLETTEALKGGKLLPSALCFVPDRVEYRVPNEHLHDSKREKPKILIKPKPSIGAKDVGKITASRSVVLYATGLEFSNNDGDWIELTKDSMKDCLPKNVADGLATSWILLQSRNIECDQFPILVPSHELEELSSKSKLSKKPSELLFDAAAIQKSGKKEKTMLKWLEVVDDCYMLSTQPGSLPSNVDIKRTEHLTHTPANWTLEGDEELVQFLVKSLSSQDYCLGGANKYVESIEVSTEQDSAHYLVDDDPDTYWESDGIQGRHYILLSIKPGVIIKQLFIGVDESDDNYMPNRVLVFGKTSDGVSKQLNDANINTTHSGDVCILENMTEYFKGVEIRIKECKEDGIDCRVHGIKIVSNKQKQAGLSRDIFDTNLVRFPKLEATDRDFLYYRSLVLLRFMSLFDSVVNYLLPLWDYTAGTFKSLEVIRQFLPLSRKVSGLVDHCLRESETPGPSSAPRIFLNRHLAAEHLVDPNQDPEAKNSIFSQLYEALRPERCEAKLDFRWSQKYDQWWECKFIGEGIIDQGGGFRDSLSDVAEELCPSSPDSPLPLPFFIRSPNQMHDLSNVYRDGYVPNPGCKLFIKYEWIGQVMGACLRGRENLALALPAYIWKCIVGEKVSWSRDYITVDAAEVKLHEELSSINKEDFERKYFGNLSFIAVPSGNGLIELKSDGADIPVTYEDLPEYLKLVQEARLNESMKQVAAIKQGLLKTVPKAVLELLTWQELERKICGESVITIEALKKVAHYENIEEHDVAVQYLWQALENFTNEDRSRFLRFVTGRRRLPAPLYIVPSRSAVSDDSLPESATCSSTLFLPKYSSAKIAEEKIRYAVYNCVAIDADMSPWEE